MPEAAGRSRPYLQPVYDEPEFIVHTVWRQYGGWWDGNPATLKPAPERALAAELAELAGGAGVLADRALHLLALAEEAGTGGAAEADRALRLAGHLVEHAWLAAPADPGVQRARRQVFATRAARATSTMARGVFSWASNEGAGSDATPIRTPTESARSARRGRRRSFPVFSRRSIVSALVDSSLTSPPVETPESPAPRRRRRLGAAALVGGGALALTGCQLPSFGFSKGATTQARSTSTSGRASSWPA